MARKNKGDPSPESERDYEVGRGKPPKQYQFKPGQCGNPKGRPKGSRSTPEVVKHHLDGAMAVRSGGHSRKMNRRLVLVHGLYERAVKGDNRAADILLRYDLASRSEEVAGGPPPTTEEDLELLKEMHARIFNEESDQ